MVAFPNRLNSLFFCGTTIPGPVIPCDYLVFEVERMSTFKGVNQEFRSAGVRWSYQGIVGAILIISSEVDREYEPKHCH